MRVRSPSTGSASATQVAGADAQVSSDAKLKGQKLLALAAERPLLPASALGVPKASLDALSRALLEGAVLVAERRATED